MRRKEKEIKSKSEIESIIKSAQVCRIAFSLNDEPYIVPMYYGYKDNFLFFHSAKQGKKIDIIKKNNRVCFEIDINQHIKNTGVPCNWKNSYSSVIGFGKAKLVENFNEKVKALNTIIDHYSPGTIYEFPKENVSITAIIKIEIEDITGKKSFD
jgi:nitroimidazol reductase NimA-like FMN-containing flavoprotein (pyridoxamine 5'-phosphate oxidase superfamily)